MGGACGSELAAWAATADASVWLIPLLAQWNAAWQQLPADQAPAEPHAAAVLFESLICKLTICGSELAEEWVNEGVAIQDAAAGSEQPTPAHLARQLCRLHKSTCSLVHWLFVSSNQALMPDCLGTDLWGLLLEALHMQLGSAHSLLAAAGEESTELELSRCVRMLVCGLLLQSAFVSPWDGQCCCSTHPAPAIPCLQRAAHLCAVCCALPGSEQGGAHTGEPACAGQQHCSGSSQ